MVAQIVHGAQQHAYALPANAVGRILKHKLRDDWNAPGTIDFRALGLTVEKSARR